MHIHSNHNCIMNQSPGSSRHRSNELNSLCLSVFPILKYISDPTSTHLEASAAAGSASQHVRLSLQLWVWFQTELKFILWGWGNVPDTWQLPHLSHTNPLGPKTPPTPSILLLWGSSCTVHVQIRWTSCVGVLSQLQCPRGFQTMQQCFSGLHFTDGQMFGDTYLLIHLSNYGGSLTEHDPKHSEASAWPLVKESCWSESLQSHGRPGGSRLLPFYLVTLKKKSPVLIYASQQNVAQTSGLDKLCPVSLARFHNKQKAKCAKQKGCAHTANWTLGIKQHQSYSWLSFGLHHESLKNVSPVSGLLCSLT